ncbi:MAG: hypothetical protein LBF27_33980 [Sphingobacterium sp.]|jgi:hypothetical protein|nr:hypothetical protein [Sphingobacterium sp.]
MENQEKRKKLKYVTPKMTVNEIEMEQGIAAGSATVNPSNESGGMKQSWESGSDSNRSMDW